VKIRNGPAAVTEDETCFRSLFFLADKNFSADIKKNGKTQEVN